MARIIERTFEFKVLGISGRKRVGSSRLGLPERSRLRK